ncbi:MAG: hypothetical protein J6S60_09245 [Oscillospiraceae bacterium]|nr:hypothetical protein [Oscillospiraceae bacterium]
MIVELIGTCPYCGQQQSISCSEFLTPDQVDVLAGEACTCAEAQRQRFEKRLEASVNNALGEGCQAAGMDYALDAEAIDFARAAGRLVWQGGIDRASFVERHGDTVRVEQKDGQVVIVRIHKKQIRM